MAIITITSNKILNNPPSSIGSYTKSSPFENKEISFNLIEFSTNYSDPENDPISKIKITELPDFNQGVLKLSGTNIALDQEIIVNDIPNLTLDISNISNGGFTSHFKFTVSDSGSNRYFEGSDAIFTVNVQAAQNLPPDSVGSKDFLIQENETLVFTRDNFTTETDPPYSDPEGDEASLLKVISLPQLGELFLNSTPVSINQIIDFNQIDSGQFTYISDISDDNPNVYIEDSEGNRFYTTTFEFEIADEGSGIFTAQ